MQRETLLAMVASCAPGLVSCAGTPAISDASPVVDDIDASAAAPDAAAQSQWSYPSVELGSRIGIHGIWSTNEDHQGPLDFINTTPFPVVKAVDDLWWLVETKERWPDTITVGRLTGNWEGVGGVDSASDDQLLDYARPAIQAIVDELTEHPEYRDAIDYWEVVNEPDPPGAQGYRKLAEVMKHAMDLADSANIKLAIFSLNAGTPEWDEMVAMVETGVFERAVAGGHILALHEGALPFSAPLDACWYEEGATIPGSPEVPRAGCLAFRYRFLYHLLEQRDAVVPLVISEFYSGPGYGHEGVPAADVRDRMAWFDDEASRDYWLLGVLPFTLGPSPGWNHQDYGWAYPALIGYMQSVRNRQNASPPP